MQTGSHDVHHLLLACLSETDDLQAVIHGKVMLLFLGQVLHPLNQTDSQNLLPKLMLIVHLVL